MLHRLAEAIRGWQTAKPKPEPSPDLIEPKPPVRFYDELVEAILREWHASHYECGPSRGHMPASFADFRILRLSDARRQANRILALPPISTIVAEWSLRRILTEKERSCKGF